MGWWIDVSFTFSNLSSVESEETILMIGTVNRRGRKSSVISSDRPGR